LLTSFNAGKNPSFFCLAGNANLIYAINEVDSVMNTRSGGLTTIRHDGSFGNLQKVNELVVPNGGPCYISASPLNDFLLMANYGGGSVAVVRLDSSGIPVSVTDTVLFTENSGKISHAHMVAFDPKGERIYVTDLGLEKIWIFTLERTTGQLIPFNPGGISLPQGTGPRHFIFNESGSRMYVIGEYNSTVTVLNVDSARGVVPIQMISTLRTGYSGNNSCADIHIGSSGLYLYGSNRGENTIVTYEIDKDGLLSLAGHTDCGGNWPRNFVIDPSGNYLLAGNQKSSDIAVFKIDPQTGIPSKKVNDIKIGSPACLKFK
jgi:6-phosphogluconolactonase